MGGKDCPPGEQWDTLVNDCIQSGLEINDGIGAETRAEAATSEVFSVAGVQLGPTGLPPQVDPGLLLSPALWMFVVLATLGSISALTFWLIICRQRRSHPRTSEDSKPEEEPLQKTDVESVIHLSSSGRNSHAGMLQSRADDPPLCPFHLHLEAQSTLEWMEDTSPYRAATKHPGTETSRGPPSCTIVREHRIPLPATELGGTALVTTKTM